MPLGLGTVVVVVVCSMDRISTVNVHSGHPRGFLGYQYDLLLWMGYTTGPTSGPTIGSARVAQCRWLVVVQHCRLPNEKVLHTATLWAGGYGRGAIGNGTPVQ